MLNTLSARYCQVLASLSIASSDACFLTVYIILGSCPGLVLPTLGFGVR